MRRDRGAVAVIASVGIVALLGMTAIAVDLGGAWADRRSMQSGADLAALAGAVELANGGVAQQAVDEVLNSVAANVPGVQAGDWAAGNCADGDSLDHTAADLGLTPATECISFKSDFSEVRVKLPPQHLGTSFAQVIGIDTITVNAAANAQGGIRYGTPPPFAILDGFQGGDTACLRTSSNIDPGPVWSGNGAGSAASAVVGSTDPCNSGALDASSQYMGTLAPPLWYKSDGSILCQNNEVPYQIAGGIDHQWARFIDQPSPGASPRYGTGGYGTPDSRQLEDECSGALPTNKPNTVQLTTGVTANALRCGLLTNAAGACRDFVPAPPAGSLPDRTARLQTGAYLQTTYKIVGENFDNEPLWNFIRADIATASAPSECVNVYDNKANGSWDYYDKRDEMVKCLDRWKDSNYDPIFDDTIVDGARFMFAPMIAEDDLDTDPTSCPTTAASKCVHINDWVPLYLQTLYFSSNSLSAQCDPNNVNVGRHHAGQQFSCAASNKNIDAASALVLACGMLPETICNPRSGGSSHYPGGNPVATINLHK